MPTVKEMAVVYEAAKELVKAARVAYPNGDEETIKTTCVVAIQLALTDDELTGAVLGGA